MRRHAQPVECSLARACGLDCAPPDDNSTGTPVGGVACDEQTHKTFHATQESRGGVTRAGIWTDAASMRGVGTEQKPTRLNAPDRLAAAAPSARWQHLADFITAEVIMSKSK